MFQIFHTDWRWTAEKEPLAHCLFVVALIKPTRLNSEVRSFITSLCFLPLMTIAQHDLPPKATPGVGALKFTELIYPLDNKPTPECHASTIAHTSNGLVAAWFAGAHEKNSDVGIWFSRHEDGKWCAPWELVDGSEGEEKELPCWNPVLFQPIEGPLLLFYKVGPDPRQWWGMLITSDDGGITWSKPRKLGENDVIGHLLGPVKNKPLQLKDGSILCPSSSEHNRWRVHFELTRDLGKTWQVIGPIHDGKEFGAIQPSILNHGNGRLQIMCRSGQKVVTQAWSDDNGASWGPMNASPLPNPNAGTDALTLKDGRHLIVYNHTTRKTGGRTMLNVAVSKDGKSWDPVMTLEKKDRGEFSYPAVIQAPDNSIHIVYTYLRQSVKHAVIDPSELKPR